MERTILLFGGVSEERLVSVASAQNMSASFNGSLWFIAEGGAVHDVAFADLQAHENPFQNPFRPKAAAFAPSIAVAADRLAGAAVFLGLHGTEGEDGSLQELFAARGVAYTGSDARASRLCFDKVAAKAEVARAGLRVVEQATFQARNEAEARAALAPLLARYGRVVMKPIANGSSVGLRIVGGEAELIEAARAAASAADSRFMAEPFVAGREVTVGVVDMTGAPEALPVSEVILENGRSFDYEGKYLGRGTLEVTPADLPPATAALCQAAALKAHRALGCYGYTRTDMIISGDGGDPVFLETNTLPGLSRASFIPQQLRAAGYSADAFVTRQLALARARALNK